VVHVLKRLMIFVQFNTVLLEGNVAVVVVAVANMTKVLLGSSLVTVTVTGEEPRCWMLLGWTNKKNKFCQKWPQNSDGKPRNGFF